ncbi:hypothetical protein HYR54_14870 [Candidatus Acetothermia bacterium]|nr:hypothetical protein [Candidatus Acetothermia bacterium]
MVEVERVPCSYLHEQGWVRKGDKVWEGWYRSIYGSFKGQIRYGKEQGQMGWHFYIEDPPTAVLAGSHRNCFVPRPNNKYWIHFSCRPKDLDSGLRETERVIRLGFEEAGRI